MTDMPARRQAASDPAVTLRLAVALRASGRAGARDATTDPVAVYVRGADPLAWLRAAHAAGLSLEGTRALLVPVSASDRRIAGALLVPDGPDRPRPTPFGEPFARRAGRLYLPVTAELAPDVSDEDVEALVAPEVAVLVPGRPLAGGARDDLPRLLSLVRPPPVRRHVWTGARDGQAPPRRITSVMPVEEPTARTLFGEAGGGIGARPFTEVPREAKGGPGAKGGGEGTGGVGKGKGEGEGKAQGKELAGDAAGAGAGAGAGGVAGGEGAEGGVAGAFSRAWRAVSDAARALGRGLTGADDPGLADARDRALDRLLRLLDSDPEEGLRYALPLGDRPLGRPGQAPPSGDLARRDPRFDLDRLGARGGASEAWRISAQRAEELRRRYRELAARDLALGRHRRAAYILAELLHDLEGAAAALKAGRHFREAAVVYRDLLKRPEAAAECLIEGGSLAEAAALLSSIGRHERAGDLYARTGDPEEAARQFRRAASACEEARAFLSAARLYEVKLARPDLALASLERGSHDPTQAALCIAERFRIWGKLERHDEARAEVLRLRDDPRSPVAAGALVEAFSGAGARYPEESLRALARDAARVVIGRRLQDGAPPGEAEALLGAVVTAEGRDRLLQRDARRWLDEKRRAHSDALRASRQGAAREAGGGRRIEVVRRFAVGGKERVRLVTATRLGESFCFVAEAKGPNLGPGTFIVGRSRGEVGSDLAEIGPAVPDAFVVFLAALTGPRGDCIIAGAQAEMRKHERREPFWTDPAHVGLPDWMPTDTIAIASGAGVFHVVRAALPDVLLATFSLGGEQLALARITTRSELEGDEDALWAATLLLATPDGVLVGLGSTIYILPDPLWKQDRKLLTLPWLARAIVAAEPAGSRRIVVTHPMGASLLAWREGRYHLGALLAPEMPSPLAAFTGEGALALASGEEGRLRLYSLEGPRPRFTGEMKLPPGTRPVALLPTARPAELLLLSEDGTALVIRAPLGGGA